MKRLLGPIVFWQVLMSLLVFNSYAGQLVQTGDIADGAVTTSKLANGAVTEVKIMDASVTSGKIADGAVTDAKISGLISASKISSATLNADTIDGLDSTVFSKKSSKVIVVAEEGGDFSDVVSAVNSITDASADNQYVIKVMPGTYGASSPNNFRLPPYVDLEGSGKNTTKIRAWSDFSQYSAVFVPENSEIRNITIECYGSFGEAIAVRLGGTIRDSYVHSFSSTTNSTPIAVISYGEKGGKIIDSLIVADKGFPLHEGIGVKALYGGSLEIYNTKIEGAIAIHNMFGEIKVAESQLVASIIGVSNFSNTDHPDDEAVTTIKDSSIEGYVYHAIINDSQPFGTSMGKISVYNSVFKSGNATYGDVGGSNVSIVNSQIINAFPKATNLRCFNNYDANFNPVVCP